MNKSLILTLLLTSLTATVHAEGNDDEGFKQPLASLKFLRQAQGAAVFNLSLIHI